MSNFGAEERAMLDDSARQYFETEYPFDRFASHSAQRGGTGWDAESWDACAKLGWLGVAVNEIEDDKQYTVASLVPAGNGFLLRSRSHLYRIGK